MGAWRQAVAGMPRPGASTMSTLHVATLLMDRVARGALFDIVAAVQQPLTLISSKGTRIAVSAVHVGS